MTASTSPPGRIETCTRCAVSFDKRPGESTASLVYRYTAWREAHAHPADAAPVGLDAIDPEPPAEPVKVRVPRRRRQKLEG